MSHKILLTGCLTAALFSGCAGRNHILFMTKSNVGLDFDAKPPTLEVTVSRKEAVIAPTFEGGQTPPIAASFKPRAGAGRGFLNFFLGVDQTFTGGDAAVAMASLYSKGGGAPPPSARTNYNSALTLTQPPKYKGILRGVPGPGETRNFIFGTDTSLGLKAAWSGAGGQFPDTVRLGFNRKEFAWAPVFLTTNAPTTNGPVTYSVKAPSFLATIQSQIDVGSSNGGIKALQYFASGETATLLAMQPAVREAMISRLDPEAAVLEDSYQKDANGDCLRKYWKPDDTINPDHQAALKKWMTDNNVDTPSITMFLRGSKYGALRARAVRELPTNCP